MRALTAKKRRDLPKIEAPINSTKLALAAPAVIVNTLYGMGVKAATKMAMKLCS